MNFSHSKFFTTPIFTPIFNQLNPYIKLQPSFYNIPPHSPPFFNILPYSPTFSTIPPYFPLFSKILHLPIIYSIHMSKMLFNVLVQWIMAYSKPKWMNLLFGYCKCLYYTGLKWSPKDVWFRKVSNLFKTSYQVFLMFHLNRFYCIQNYHLKCKQILNYSCFLLNAVFSPHSIKR